ncbi:hypothetical protein [Bifidobacterium callimiconis]|uniref:Uncharacterized protein n=1 Tax=Bifidobacterium callimiconis TaxID=2306973 RepID=A0A430FBR3_9BIFI|nr:hypothetical protein [Bifidobacterium callimiconis]RSX50270.1 hypothetical protein D2E23_1818 [Bifidobacterium callimiconis]
MSTDHARAWRIRRGILRDLARRSRTGTSRTERARCARAHRLARHLIADPAFWLSITSRDLERIA